MKIIFTSATGQIGIKNLVSVQVIEAPEMNELYLKHFRYSSQWKNTVIYFQILVFNTSSVRRYNLYCKLFPFPVLTPQTRRLLFVLKTHPSQSSAMILSVGGRTETHYFKYIRYILKENAW